MLYANIPRPPNQQLFNYLKTTILLILSLNVSLDAQQSNREQSTIDLFGNKNPIFNYMPNTGHVDVDRLDQIQQYTDLREEEGNVDFPVLVV